MAKFTPRQENVISRVKGESDKPASPADVSEYQHNLRHYISGEAPDGSIYAVVNGVTVDLASDEYAAWYYANYG